MRVVTAIYTPDVLKNERSDSMRAHGFCWCGATLFDHVGNLPRCLFRAGVFTRVPMREDGGPRVQWYR